MRRKNTRAARQKDKLRKQLERAQIHQSFVYQVQSNEWKNEKITRLQIPSQLLGTSNQNTIGSLPLTAPRAVHPIAGDGNCLFSAFSYVLTGTEKHYHHIRLSICDFMKTNPHDIQTLLPISAADAQSYLMASHMEIDGTWGTEVEIVATAVLLQTNIYVYSKHGVHWKWIKHSPSNTNMGIYLYHKDENHFEVVEAVENSEVPPHLSPNQYYNPLAKQQCLKRKKKQEIEKERIRKRYNSDDKFKSRKKETQKRVYHTNENVRTKKIKLQKDRYYRVPNVKNRQKQYEKDRYNLDTAFRKRKLQSQKMRYISDPLFSAQKKQCTKQLYHKDQFYKKKEEDDINYKVPFKLTIQK